MSPQALIMRLNKAFHQELIMEEMHRTHKESSFGWVGLLLKALARLRARAPRSRAGVVTPWSANAPRGWSA
jgi:hypothetical protein